jgi:hypothetical protein
MQDSEQGDVRKRLGPVPQMVGTHLQPLSASLEANYQSDDHNEDGVNCRQ